MTKRKPLEIKKKILSILKEEKKISVKQLERKVNTNYQTIVNNCEELEYLGFIKVNRVRENSNNGRDYLIVELTKNKI
jgi:predicted transcriptional regulator